LGETRSSREFSELRGELNPKRSRDIIRLHVGIDHFSCVSELRGGH